MSFRQQALGNFSIDVIGEFHCGPDNTSPKIFNYEVELRYPTGRAALDEHGFLLDNTFFRLYFSSLKETSLSCELLVIHCAHEIHTMTQGRADYCRVRLWAIAHEVFVEYECSGPEGGILTNAATA